MNKLDRIPILNNETYRKVLLWSGILILTLGGTYSISYFALQGNGQQSTTLAMEVTDKDIYTGNFDAPNTLVEYSDFTCPACKATSGILKELLNQKGEELRIIYRYFPLEHQNSYNSAYAAESAKRQGKFWEMHDQLFATSNEWSTLNDDEVFLFFEGLASSIEGMDVEKWKEDYNLDETKNVVEESLASGIASGVKYTPYIFFNGESLAQNPGTVDEYLNLFSSNEN